MFIFITCFFVIIYVLVHSAAGEKVTPG